MGSVRRWTNDPPPRQGVIALLEQALEAARHGHIQAVTIVTVNPVHDVEHKSAGVRGVLRFSLIGGLSSAAQYLINNPSNPL